MQYISKLEELRDQWRESQDAIDEIKDTVEESGKDEYFDMKRIKEALIKRQDEIMLSIKLIIPILNFLILCKKQLDEYR